ncbi:MAG: S41 family peptidase [Alistipes sp.]|nr:S41 family peptidase [Alistipes sp.]
MRRFLIAVVMALICSYASAQLTEQQQIQKLNLVYQQIRNNYVDDVPLEPLVEEAIIATLKELDPHSQYLSKEDMAALQTRVRGEFAGIGIRYIVHNDTLVVRSTIENSPASRAGIRPNDRIISADYKDITSINADSISTILRGEAGSNLRLVVVRRGESNHREINLKRDYVESSAINSSYRIGDVGYIAISAFSKPMPLDFYAAYKALGDIRSLIIDLRNNSGGAISSAIDLSSLFLKKGDLIVTTEGKTSQKAFHKTQDRITIDIPIVVIINENSASASEIFAGAIQDHDRGVIIGHTSYGKGLVQRVIELKDGSGITLTIARYKTPSGRVIQRPYEMGNEEKYMRDSVRFQHPDSIPHDETLIFTTLKRGRKVYGGGGITPDIYIDTNNLELSEYLYGFHSEALFDHAIIDYMDSINAESLREQYPTYETFDKEYTLDGNALEIFCHYAKIEGCTITPRDKEYIELMLRASIAEELYGSNARHYIYGNHLDPMIKRGVEIAQQK